jgi:hypothetical protein
LGGPPYEQSLRAHLQVKYQDKPIGVVVAIGDATLEYVLRSVAHKFMARHPGCLFYGRRNDRWSIEAAARCDW